MSISNTVDLTLHPAHGTFPPTAAQRRILRWFHSTPLGFSRLRRPAINAFKAARAGPVDATLFGLKVRFHPHDNQTDSKSAVCGRCYNADETRWLSRILKPGAVFVDVGANMGFFSLFAASRGARVLAIEPLPTLFERMSLNMALNGFSAHRFNEAVGPTAGTVVLYPATDLGGTSILGAGAGIETPVRPLLDLVREAGVDHIDALKIDVEGWEDRVLCPFFETAPPALWPRAIVIEHSSGGQWVEDLLGRMTSLGYVRKVHNRANAMYVFRPVTPA
ncbi:MAG: FkbM family methyltransferase [Caulobacter sp.]|nr:FkbM family methyltransferase [Caulobacter sp.]